MSQTKTIAIIGGGVTGLSAAYHAQVSFPGANIVLLESADRLGGVLQTDHVDGYTIERSADMFVTDPPDAFDVCQRLGHQDELIQTTPTQDRAFVATGDSMHPVPSGLSLMLPNDLDSVLGSALLDEKAKQRFQQEKDVPVRQSDQDESLESFAVRRFGQSVFEQLIQPLVSGIYTADPKKLSMNATMKRFVDMEQKHGSLISAAESSKSSKHEKQASGARYGLFRAPQKGMEQLVGWLVESLSETELRLSCHVDQIEKTDSGWKIQARSGPDGSEESQTIDADGIVIATSAAVAGKLIDGVDGELAQQLGTIQAASSAIVVMGVDRDQVKQQFEGYGIIVPSVLNRNVIATSFSSNKFAGRAPAGKLLVRTFIGGALQPELVELDDEALVKIAVDELDATVGFSGQPELSRVYRWRNCMPQYHLGHVERVESIRQMTSRHHGLQLAGNSYHGVGIPACIQSGSQAIERLAGQISD